MPVNLIYELSCVEVSKGIELLLNSSVTLVVQQMFAEMDSFFSQSHPRFSGQMLLRLRHPVGDAFSVFSQASPPE